MSRFGLRKRLKKALGRGGGQDDIVRHSVTYLLPDGTERTIEAEEHYSLLMAADAAGITISTGRRAGGTCPDGQCGLCRVEIEDATGLSEMKPHERKSIDDHVAGTEHEGRPRQPERGGQVDREHGLPFLVLHAQREVVAGEACIVD